MRCPRQQWKAISSLYKATVLVDLIKLREEGQKRSPDALRLAVPLRGLLVVKSWRVQDVGMPGQQLEGTDAALELPHAKRGGPLVWLKDVRLRSARSGALVLLGREAYGNPSAHTYHPQAWWCRVVVDPEQPAADALAPIHAPGGLWKIEQ